MNKYIKIARPDHWIKQFFIVPGILFAYILIHPTIDIRLIKSCIFCFISTCLVASSNYVINEWLDAKFDRFHPTKKHRSVVENDLKPQIVWTMYIGLAILGFIFGYLSSPIVCGIEVWLWVMGILYNVRPFRTKDIPVVDVLTESVNNAIRLLLGWFSVTSSFLPPISIIIGYWMVGAFLMAMKRFAEYRMINDPKIAGSYRKSFKYYTTKSLLVSSFFYAMTSVLFSGIFLIKYRIELILFMPVFIGLFCYYFYIAYKEDSAVQKPEKLFREKGLMIYCLVLFALFFLLIFVDIPQINILISEELIGI